MMRLELLIDANELLQMELIELVLLLVLDKDFHAEQFEERVSQVTVPSSTLSERERERDRV